MIVAFLRATLEDLHHARQGLCCICRQRIKSGYLCDDCQDAL